MLFVVVGMTEPDKTLFAGESALFKDLGREGDALLVTFGGIAQGIGMPRFEFLRITNELSAKLLFARDISQSWYHSELPEIGLGIVDLAKTITEVTAEAKVKRVVCVGNSMGGYAALLLGSLTAADQVIAFAPQTFLTRRLRFIHGDRRWREQCKKLYSSPHLLKPALNLKQYLANPSYGHAVIYADPSLKVDAAHAKHLQSLPRTSVCWVQGGHNLVKGLRDSGELLRILSDACG